MSGSGHHWRLGKARIYVFDIGCLLRSRTRTSGVLSWIGSWGPQWRRYCRLMLSSVLVPPSAHWDVLASQLSALIVAPLLATLGSHTRLADYICWSHS